VSSAITSARKRRRGNVMRGNVGQSKFRLLRLNIVEEFILTFSKSVATDKIQ
jgi:hypothetical protein